MAQTIDFVSLLHKSQEYISENYAAALSDRSKIVQLRSYIEKYLHDSGFEVEGMTFRELADKLYSEMAEYSVLTKYLGRDEIEEININGWDDIAVTYTDGHIEKAKEHFYNPQHAVDVVKRLLHHSGMIIDNATPMSQGHLPGNTRITALKEPLVDDDRGISVSIRLLHPSRVDMKALVKGGNATQKMIDFLCMCLRYGISFVVAGATSSGKTTLLNALLTSIPDNKRIFTIESGSRELSLVKVKDGKVVNNVVHTLSRPSDNPAYLYIRVTHKTPDEMAQQYGFTDEQKEQLRELLSDKNKKMWNGVLYGYTASGEDIVSVALSQLGNKGGEPYWRWYGFGSRVEWCCCFVSWCANECGYIDAGVIPKYAGTSTGVNWFKERGQWLDGSAEPSPGMIIFYDWAKNGLDGQADHTAIPYFAALLI